MNEKYWYAVYTKPKWEKKVSEILTKRSIENYCPLSRVSRQWSDRRKIIFEPLFKSYVFVRVNKDEINNVLSVNGIINIVYWLKRPAIIRDVEIKIIRQFLGEYENVRLEKIAANINDNVRILSGPFSGWEGTISEIKNQTLKVSLPTLGFRMVVEITSNICKI